jgi:hypothetical protein
MDMSSLQNDLPCNKPSPPPSLPPPTLTADFRSAALAVTKLYQNSARQIDLARQEGYLSAVQEVAALLSQGELAGDRLREWCAVGLSHITAQQDEENRTRPNQERNSEEHIDEGNHERREIETSSSPVLANRMQPLQNPFGDGEFTFHVQSPLPSSQVRTSGYSSPFGARLEPEVTYEVVENVREGGGRKRGVSHQPGVWDLGGNGGNKRSRYM